MTLAMEDHLATSVWYRPLAERGSKRAGLVQRGADLHVGRI